MTIGGIERKGEQEKGGDSEGYCKVVECVANPRFAVLYNRNGKEVSLGGRREMRSVQDSVEKGKGAR